MPILLPSHDTTNSFNQFRNETNKSMLLQYFTRISGTGTMSYNSAGTTTEGLGRFEFTGTGRWELSSIIPVSEFRGLELKANHFQNSGSATVRMGINCRTAVSSLGDRNCFFTGSSPGATTNIQQYIYLSGGTVNNYVSGTTFGIFYINISANNGTYVIDRPHLDYMAFAQKALYI